MRSTLFLLGAKLASECISAANTFVTLGDWGGAALGSYYLADVTAVSKALDTTVTTNDPQFIVNTGDAPEPRRRRSTRATTVIHLCARRLFLLVRHPEHRRLPDCGRL